MKINFFAPINNLGYGIHSYYTIREFEKLGNQVLLIPPFGQVSRIDKNVERWLNQRVSFNKNNVGIMIFNEEYLTQFHGGIRIGFPVFELEKFTELQLACIKSCDAVFTPSKWGEGVLRAHGIRNVHVVNEGYDPDEFPVNEISEAELSEEPFTFLHVGKFETRKGTLQAIECFFQALENENAKLILHIHNPFIKDYVPVRDLVTRLGFTTVNNGITWRRAGLSISFTQSVDEHHQMAELYKRADFGLYPTRAEGWGLPILETLVSGIPCIVGAWTGQSEYLNEGYEMAPFILNKPIRQKAQDGLWFFGDRGEWNVPTDSELIDKIRLAYQSGRSFRKSEDWKKALQHFRGFTWERAAHMLQDSIKKVWGV